MSGRTYEFEDNTVADHDGRGKGRDEDGAGERGARDSARLRELLGTGPLFGVVRRGYDRLAVDAYVESTEQELRTLRRRLHTMHLKYRSCADALVAARRRPEDQAAHIIDEARVEAEARMTRVATLREAAQVARDEARRDRTRAASELAAARRQSQEMLADAYRAREDAEATASLRMVALEADMADLVRQRDEARAHLQRLTSQIEQALHSLTAVLPADDARALAAVPEPGEEALAG